MERTVFLVALLAVGAFAGPIAQTVSVKTCAKQCTGTGKFDYQVGKTYEFQYDANTRLSFQGASEDHSGIRMSATVHLDVLSRCELVMRLSDVSLTEYDPVNGRMTTVPGEFRTAMEESPLRVSFQDGNIEELCLTGEEPAWVTNVKRGILSVFQNNMDDFETSKNVREVDVMGDCETNYTAGEKGWYHVSVQKTKDLLGCMDRTHYNTAIQHVPYKVNSGIQNMPVLKSTQECQHKIDHRVKRLQEATCSELHVFRPFSRENSGASTQNTQRLTFIRETTSNAIAGVPVKTVPIKFEHDISGPQEQSSEKDELVKRLKDICESTKSGMQPDTPRLFTALVYTMRLNMADALSSVYAGLESGSFCPDNTHRVKQFFLDALPLTGTSSSLSLMGSLLTNNKVSEEETSVWMTSLNFIKHPSKEILAEIKPLLSLPGLEEKVLLTAGSLVHTYCTMHAKCETEAEVHAIITAIESKIGACKVKVSNSKTVLLSLRALGNAGVGQSSAINTLNNCLSSKNPIEIRLAAIDAFRRMSSNSVKRNVNRIFRDTEEDSEIRIAAYKSLMQNPDAVVLRTVKETLESGVSQQVKSYVWSHLTNLMETSDPHKQEVKKILLTMNVNEFDKEHMKFSKNYEKSMFLELLNAGGKAEADVIWSSKSFLPRSGMLNLTVDMFGNSVNLFEIGCRAEGLEFFMESMLGPNGYFSDNKPATGSKRALQGYNKLGKMNKRFEKDLDELKASFYLRIFGNELRYMSFQGIDSLTSSPNFNILEMLIKMSQNNDYTYTQSYMFLDSTMVIPTGSGFPMSLSLNGSVTVDLKASGRMDVRSPPSLDIEGLIQPSAAVAISSMATIDAFVTKCGIKMASSLNTNTGVKGHIRVSDTGIISAEYGVPEPKTNIISVKSSFFTVHRNTEKEQVMVTDNRQTKQLCTPNPFTKVTGLELCAEVEYPNASMVAMAPYFPLTGPINAGLYLYKRDSHVKYTFTARSSQNRNTNVLHLAFDTPDSRIDRHVELNFQLDKATKTVDMAMQSPWKSASFQGSFTSQHNIAGMSGRMNVDGNSVFLLNTQLTRERVKNEFRYTPIFELNIPERTPINLRATVRNNNLREIQADFNIAGVTEQPISGKASIFNKPFVRSFNGEVSLVQGKPYTASISISTQKNKRGSNFKPLVSIRTPVAEVLAFGGSLGYIEGQKVMIDLALDKVVEKEIKMKGFFALRPMKRKRTIYRSKMDFTSAPLACSWDASADNRGWKTIATNVGFKYVIRRVSRNDIKIASKIVNLSASTLTNWKFSTDVTVKRNPELNTKLSGNLNHNAKHSELTLDLLYGVQDPNRHLDISFELDRNFKSLTSASANLTGRIRHAGQGVAVYVKGAHNHTPKELDSMLQMRFGKATTIETSLQLRDKTRQDLIRLSGDYVLEIPGRRIRFNHSVEQVKTNELATATSLELRKGEAHSVSTHWTAFDTQGLIMVSSIKIHEMMPVTLKGKWHLDPENFVSLASFERNKTVVSGMLTSVTVPGYASKLDIDILYPSRRIMYNFDGKRIDNRWTTESTLKWNAGVNDDDLVALNTEINYPGNNISGSAVIRYPSRELKLNAHHTNDAKYASHVDFSWEESKQVSIDTTFEHSPKRNGRIVIGDIKISSPFRDLRYLNIDLTHMESNEEYKSTFNTNWNPTNTIRTTVVLKKPLSLKSLVAKVIGKTSFKSVKKFNFDLDHKLSNVLSTHSKLGWNRQSITADISASNKSTVRRTFLEGAINIQTTLSTYKKLILTMSHGDDGQEMISSVKLLRNKKEYKVTSELSRKMNGYNLNTQGTIALVTPAKEMATSWKHSNSESDITTSVTSNWGKRLLSLNLNGHKEFQRDSTALTGSITIQTPFRHWSELNVQMNHNHTTQSLDSALTISVDGSSITETRSSYSFDGISSRIGKIDVKIQPLNVSMAAAMESTRPSINTGNARFDLSLTPSESFSLQIDSQLTHDQRLKTDIVATSPYPGYDRVAVTQLVTITDNELGIKYQLSYPTGQTIAAEAKLNKAKQTAFVSLSTPYTVLQHLQMELITSLKERESTVDFSIQAIPHFRRISTVASVTSLPSGMQVKTSIDTPFRQFPHFEAFALSQLVDDKRESIFKVEYLPRKQIILESTHSLNDLQQADFRMSLTTPFDALPNAALDLSHSGNSSRFKSHAAIEYMVGQKIGADISFSNIDNTEGSMTISSPFSEDFIGTFNLNGNMRNMQWHSEIASGPQKRFTTDLTLQQDLGTSSGSGSVEWRLNSCDGEVSFSHSASLERFNGHLQHSSRREGISEIKLSYDLTNNIEGRISMQSPYTANIVSTLNHQQELGEHSYFNTDAEVSVDSMTLLKATSMVSTDAAITGEFTLVNPYSDKLRLYGRSEGTLNNFRATTQFDVGNRRTDLTVSTTFGSDWKEGRLVLKTPDYPESTASVSYSGHLANFKSTASLSIFGESHSVGASLRTTPDIDGSFEITSPRITNTNVKFTHVGSIRDFRCTAEATLGIHKTEAGVTFNMNRGYVGQASLTSSLFPDITVSFRHSGGLKRFNSNLETRYGASETSGNIDFTLNGNAVLLATQFKTPMIEDFSMSYKHEGAPTNFRCDLEVYYGTQSNTAELSFNMTDTVRGSMNVLLFGYDPISFSFDQHGKQLSNFRFGTELGFLRNLHEMSVETTSRPASFEGTLKIESPLIENIQVNTRFNGPLGSCSSSLEVTKGSDEYSVSTSLTSDVGIAAELSVFTPLDGYRNIRGNLKHQGVPSNFQSEVSLSVDNSRHIGSASFNMEAFEGSFSTQSPAYPNIRFTFSKEGTIRRMTPKASLVFNDVAVFTVIGIMQTEPFILAEIHLTTPVEHYRTTDLVFRHDSLAPFGFHCQANGLFGGKKSNAELKFNLDRTAEIDGLLKVETAYLPHLITEMKVTITPGEKLSGVSSLKFNEEQKFNMNFDLEHAAGIDSRFTIRSAFENFTEIAGTFKLNSHQLDTLLDIEGSNILHCTAMLESNEKRGIAFSLQSQFTQPLKGSFYYMGGYRDLQSESELSYGQKKVSNKVQFTLATEPFVTTGSISVITPASNEFTSSFKLSGELLNFNGHIEGSVNVNRISSDLTFAYPNLAFTFDLALPNFNTIRASLSNKSSFKRVNTDAVLDYGEGAYEFLSSINWRRGIDASWTAKTPIPNYRKSQLTFAMDGQFPNVRTTTKLTNFEKSFEISTHLTNTTSYSAGMTISTPYEGYETIGLNFYQDGTWSKFTAGGKLSYATGSDVEVGIEHDWSPLYLRCKLHILSPFTDPILISLNHTGTPMDFSTDFEASMSPGFSTVSSASLRTGPAFIDFSSASKTTYGGESSHQASLFKHNGNLNNFRTSASYDQDSIHFGLTTSFHSEPTVEGSISIQTPFENFRDSIASFSHTGSQTEYRTSGQIHLNPAYRIAGDLVIENRGWNFFTSSVELSTPFDAMKVIKSSYRHTGRDGGLECQLEMTHNEREFTGVLRASKTPMSFDMSIVTPFPVVKQVFAKGNYAVNNRGRYTARIETGVNKDKIVLDGSLVARSQYRIINGRLTLNTPFELVSSVVVEGGHQGTGDKWIENFKTTYNGDSVLDFEVDHNMVKDHKEAVITIRAPKPIKMEAEFDISPMHSNLEIVANWNTETSDSNIRIESGFDRRTSNTASFKIIRPEHTIEFNGHLDLLSKIESSADLSWGTMGNQTKAGFDIMIDANDARTKVILPSRSLQLIGTKRQSLTETTFMWDADADSTKKVTLRAVVTPTVDSIRAEFNLMMPSIAKNVQVDSQMIVNRGRVIFDGKTQFTYSTDSSKTITILSRLEDKSWADTKNYSFSLGVSHPYSTVGIQLDSHLGESQEKLSCGAALEYLTADRQMKKFNVKGQINKLRKTVSLEMVSPVKSISISGRAEMEEKFEVSLLNVYDQKTPVSTVFTIDPALKSIAFKINYDLENPSSEFNMQAKYINSTAVSTEVFHVVNNQKTTDFLMTSVLNTSYLLHGRLHWNTQAGLQYEEYRTRKAAEYERRLTAMVALLTDTIYNEVNRKSQKIFTAIEEEIGQENMNTLAMVTTEIMQNCERGYLDVTLPLRLISQDTSLYITMVQPFNRTAQMPTPFAIMDINIEQYIRLPARHLPRQVHGLLNSTVLQLLPASIKQQIDNANKFWEIEENLAEALEEVLLWLQQEVESELLRLKDCVDSPITIYDPVHGEVQAEFDLPLPVYSLDVIPTLDISQYVSSYMPTVQMKMPSLPSFEGFARMTGFSTVTTFDGVTYDLPSTFGNLLLARDFTDSNFTIIAKKNPEPVLFAYVNDQAIELRENGEVRVSGSPVELPFSRRNVTITREPVTNTITVSGAGSFTIEFKTTNGVSDMLLHVNRFYFGKTAGLFGTFDNEPSNDLMTSFTKVIDDPDRFLRTWSI